MQAKEVPVGKLFRVPGSSVGPLLRIDLDDFRILEPTGYSVVHCVFGIDEKCRLRGVLPENPVELVD